MRKLVIIGIGTGNPEHMTVQGINALNSVDVVLVPRKGPAKDDLARLRREICDRFLTNAAARIVEFDLPVRDAAEPSYADGVRDWHAAIAATYHNLLLEHTSTGSSVALLVWGDPSLYDSTLRIVELLRDSIGLAVDHEVVPGITSIQALAAGHRMPLNTIGNAFQVTTGRRLVEGFPDATDTAVVMLDGNLSFHHLDGRAFDIFWGAYLGTKDEVLVSGLLSDVADEIGRLRSELRRQHGWIMDTYLLRKRSGAPPRD